MEAEEERGEISIWNGVESVIHVMQRNQERTIIKARNTVAVAVVAVINYIFYMWP